MKCLAIGVALLLALAVFSVASGALSDYAYRIPITISNDSGADLTNASIPIPVNAANLVDNNYIQPDADDVQVGDVSGTELLSTLEDIDANGAYWWTQVASLSDASTGHYYLHVGDADGSAVDQGMYLDSVTALTVANAASLQVSTDLTVQARVEVPALPTGTEYLIRKVNQYYLSVDAANFNAGIYPVPDSYTSSTAAISVYGVNWSAQTFTTGANGYTADHLYIRVLRAGSPGTVTVGITATAAGEPTGADLTSCTFDGDTLTTDGAGELKLCDITNYALSASTQYAIVVRATSGDVSNYIEWRHHSSGALANGQRWGSGDSGSTWPTSAGSSDLSFRIFALVTRSATASTSATTVRSTYDGTDFKLYIDDVEEATIAISGDLNVAADSTTSDIDETLASGEVYQWRVGASDVGTPTWRLDLDFEPANITLDDVGDAGDSWGWEGTIDDQSASSNDGSYAITRDMSHISVLVGGIELKSLTTDVQSDEEVVDMIGDPGVNPDTASDSNTWLLRPFFDTAEAIAPMSTDAFWFLMWGTGTMILGMLTYIVVHRFAGVDGGLLLTGIVMFCILFLGYALTPLDFWFALIGGTVCLIGIPLIGRFARQSG